MNTDPAKVQVKSFAEERSAENGKRIAVRRWHVSWFGPAGEARRLTFDSWERALFFAAYAGIFVQDELPSEPPC